MQTQSTGSGRKAIRINPKKTAFERIEQKNRLFFALMNCEKRGLSLATQHRIVQVVFP